MSDEIDKILESALNSQKDLSKIASQTIAKYSMHLDKVDPKIKAQFENESKNIDSLQKELNERLEAIDKLKNNI